MAHSEPMFGRGDWVALKSDPGHVGMISSDPVCIDAAWHYEVYSASARLRYPEAELVAQAERELGFRRHRAFLRDLAVLKLSGRFSDVIYSMGASRTKFLVYQFQPVLKFIRSWPHGMLVADEVGLGKTIEAGLILKELIARGSVRRVLVACPANLTRKWRDEMQHRFGLDFRIIRLADLRDVREQAETYGWPSMMAIASIESLRTEEAREILQQTQIQFELVIIDEAHHLRNAATQSFDLGEVLGEQSDHILLLSATPVQTGSDDLLSLLRLIEPADFSNHADFTQLIEPNRYINRALGLLSRPRPDANAVGDTLRGVLSTTMAAAFRDNPLFNACLERVDTGELSPSTATEVRRDIQQLHTLSRHFTRTRKREVEELARRRSRVVHVELQQDEANFYAAWIEYAIARATVRTPNAPPTWLVSMRERQAASSLKCATVALESLLRGDVVSDVESSDPELEVESEDGPLGLFSADRVLEVKQREVRAAATSLVNDSKLDALLEVLHELLNSDSSRKILLFTFFKNTLRHLDRSLSAAGFSCYSISGDDSPERRAETVGSFQADPRANVLLSTEVGSEGLDFQFCNAVVNYDLPWNPMRVEQRIGRIDRFGQRAAIIDVVSFFVGGTIDTKILERLYDRIKVFEESIGELEPILGPLIKQIERDAFSPVLTDEEKQQKADEAILRAEVLQRQNEEYESARAELLGQGDTLREEIEAIRSTGRYPRPEELHALLFEWLDSHRMGKDALEPTDRDGIYMLRLSPRTIARVEQWMTEHRRRDPAVNALLAKLHADGRSWCTFDPEIAQENAKLPFIDTAHVLVQVATQSQSDDDLVDPFARVARLERDDAPDRHAVAFVYRLAVTGVEARSSLVAVAVSDSGVASLELGDDVLANLRYMRDAASAPSITSEALEELERTAYRVAESERARAQTYASDMQQSRIATKRASIDRSYRARIQRKVELLARATDPRIERMYEGEIRRLRAARDEKVTPLDSLDAPTAGLELLAILSVSRSVSGAR